MFHSVECFEKNLWITQDYLIEWTIDRETYLESVEYGCEYVFPL